MSEESRKAPVYWTQEEVAILGREMMRAEIDPTQYAFCREMRAVQEAVLPANRRKGLTASSQLKDVVDWVEDEKKRLVKEAKRAADAAAKAEREAAEAEAAQLAELAATPPPAVPLASVARVVQVAPLAALDKLLSEVAREIAQRFGTHLQTEIRSVLTSTIASSASASVVPAKHEAPLAKPRPTKVMVLGLKDSVASQFKREYEGRNLDFRFVDADASGSAAGKDLRAKVDNMDYVFSTKWTNHSLTGMVKHHPRHKHLYGGFDELRDQLNKIAPVH